MELHLGISWLKSSIFISNETYPRKYNILNIGFFFFLWTISSICTFSSFYTEFLQAVSIVGHTCFKKKQTHSSYFFLTKVLLHKSQYRNLQYYFFPVVVCFCKNTRRFPPATPALCFNLSGAFSSSIYSYIRSQDLVS